MRFNQIYLLLLLGAFLCAFVIPPELTDSARLHATGLFTPVSYPIRRIASAVYRPFDHLESADTRSNASVLAENDQLKQEVARLSAQVDRLQKLESERQNLGSLKAQSVRAVVAGADAAGRDALLLSLSPTANVHQGDAVLYTGGLAGSLDAASGAIGGARVRLISDKGVVLTGDFVRFVSTGGKTEEVHLQSPPALVRGLGNGMIGITDMKETDIRTAGVRPGDWVVLDDPQWPGLLGATIGRVAVIKPSRLHPLFDDISIATQADLRRLSDVWIVPGRL